VIGPALRRAIQSDAPLIRALVRSAYAKWVPMIGREPQPMVVDYAQAIRDHVVDLLCVEDQLVALIETVPEPGYLLIENVAVAPGCQGRGYGRLLMEHAEQFAASLGRMQVRLYTNARFTENIRFYDRLGYTVDRQEPFKDGVRVHMSKHIGNPGLSSRL